MARERQEFKEDPGQFQAARALQQARHLEGFHLDREPHEAPGRLVEHQVRRVRRGSVDRYPGPRHGGGILDVVEVLMGQ